LNDIKTIALVGASPKVDRPSNEVMLYLQEKGYQIVPINPAAEGQEILGEQVISSVSKLRSPVDMIEIFRNSKAAGEVCEEVLSLPEEKRPKVVWMQIGVVNDAAAAKLRSKGMKVVMDQCPKRILKNQTVETSV
jgi:predicted CoA-binding protein